MVAVLEKSSKQLDMEESICEKMRSKYEPSSFSLRDHVNTAGGVLVYRWGVSWVHLCSGRFDNEGR